MKILKEEKIRDTTVCSCRHTKSSASVGSMYCVCVCGRSGTVLKNDKGLLNPSVRKELVRIVKAFISHACVFQLRN
jgi:hypothetical protein